jgi:RNA polymerase sigma-70 factor (ECF subfamily)
LTPDHSNETDAELARQSQAGSLAAFEELVYRHEHRVYAFVAQFCRNTADARELTQDTFAKAAQSMRLFDARREFAPWLLTIARHKWIDRQRAAPPSADAPMPEMVDENTPSELLAQREDRQDLWRVARRCLSANQFQALWLRYAEDMDVAQIAGVLGKSRVHVKVILFRARQILGRQLQSDRMQPAVDLSPRLNPRKINYSQPAGVPSTPVKL